MKNKIALGLALTFIFSAATSVAAFKKESFVSYNVPIQSGMETEVVNAVDLIVKEATFSAVPVTFYLDYETVKTASMAAYFKKVLSDYPYHKLGLWTKIDKTLLVETTPYEGDKSISYDSMKNLSAYAPSDRYKLIDQMASQYLLAFGNYPQTIIDDYVDSASAAYWSSSYGVIGSLGTFGELGLKMSVTDGKNNNWFNRYFPYLMSKRNGLVPGRTREMSLRFVVSPGSTLDLNPNLVNDLPDITNKQLSELTYLALVSPVSKNSQQEMKLWAKIYRDFADKYSLRWMSQEFFSDLYLARYPYYTPAFSRNITIKDKKYWMVFNKDYFSAINLSDQTLTNLSLFEDEVPEAYWFEYNKQPELVLNTTNIAQDQKIGIGINYKQDTEYWRTWVTDGSSKVDFMPEKVVFVPAIDLDADKNNIKVKNTGDMTTVSVVSKRGFVYWPFVALGSALILLYVLQRRR
jgi:hypothetical protein